MYALPTISPRALVERLEEVRTQSAQPGVLAFDCDGTLWSGDVGVDLFSALLARRAIQPSAVSALRAEAREYEAGDDGDPHALAARLHDRYHQGTYPHMRLCALMAWAFAGYHRQQARRFADEVMAGAGLAARFQREVEPVLAWAQQRDVAVYLVSASPRCVVQAAAATIGVAPENVLAVTPAEDANATLLPRVLDPLPHGDGKAHVIAAACPNRTLLGAFGDNGFDAAMLRAAKVRVAVRPKEALRQISADVPGLVELRDAVDRLGFFDANPRRFHGWFLPRHHGKICWRSQRFEPMQGSPRADGGSP